MLTEEQAVKVARELHDQQQKERNDLDVLRRYATGKQALPLVIPPDAPREVREMARIGRINLIAIVVNALVESLYVDNIRVPDADDDPTVNQLWQTWQANRLDRSQAALYRAVFTYGYGYMAGTPGDDLPVLRAVSPRHMTAMYGADPDWPAYALETRRDKTWRLIDDEAFYLFGRDEKGNWGLLAEPAPHGLDYCPVVKYADAEDLDLDDEPVPMIWPAPEGNQTCIVAGQVAPLMTLQDQADVTSFGLLSAQWYTAFRQRWVKGWTPDSRGDRVKSGASQLWAFDEHPDDVALGEFSETTLDGYLRSRDAILRYGATLSQTPVHELTGELVNLSAEALSAAEAGRDRKVDLRKTGLGESHEQTLTIAGDLLGIDVPDDLEVVWRDTSARAFGAVVDGLGKLAQMLQIPPQELWDRIPGVTKQDVDAWKQAAKSGDALSNLTTMLANQSGQVTPTAPAVDGTTTSPGGVILPRGVQA